MYFGDGSGGPPGPVKDVTVVTMVVVPLGNRCDTSDDDDRITVDIDGPL